MERTVDKNMLHAVIDDMPQNELELVYKMFSGFIRDYQDRHLTNEEYEAHMQALDDNEWYE